MRRQSVVYLKDAGASIGFWVQGHLVVTSPPVAVIMPGCYLVPVLFYFAGFPSGTVYSILASVTLLHWALVNTWSRPSAAGKPQRSPHVCETQDGFTACLQNVSPESSTTISPYSSSPQRSSAAGMQFQMLHVVQFIQLVHQQAHRLVADHA